MDAPNELIRVCRELAPVDTVIAQLKASTPGTWPSAQQQVALAAALGDDHRCASFATSLRHRRALLSNLIDAVERAGVQPEDALMELFCETLDDAGATSRHREAGTAMCYAHYLLARDTDHDTADSERSKLAQTAPLLHIRRAESVFGETGLAVWGPGLLLSEYAISSPATFCGKRVLELGAGTGLVGCTVAAVTSPRSVVLTDYCPADASGGDDAGEAAEEVLRNLRHNVEVNAASFGASVPVTVIPLDWTELARAAPAPHTAAFDALRADVVLAADCVFDLGLNVHLATVTQWLLQPHKPATAAAAEVENAPIAIFSCGARNLETLDHFISLFDPARWCVDDVSDEIRACVGNAVFCHDSLLSAGSGTDARQRTRLLQITARAKV